MRVPQLQISNDFHQQRRPQGRQGIVQFSAGNAIAHGQFALRVDRPGIQTGIELHDAHAALGVTGQNRTLYRRRAAPARQQRGVNIEASQARQRQHGGGQNEPIGHHHHQLRRPLAQAGELRFARQAQRLSKWQSQLQGALLDRAGVQRAAPPGGTIRLREHAHHLVR